MRIHDAASIRDQFLRHGERPCEVPRRGERPRTKFSTRRRDADSSKQTKVLQRGASGRVELPAAPAVPEPPRTVLAQTGSVANRRSPVQAKAPAPTGEPITVSLSSAIGFRLDSFLTSSTRSFSFHARHPGHHRAHVRSKTIRPRSDNNPSNFFQ